MSPHTYDDDGTERECGDEGRVCDECFDVEKRYWAAYFGLSPEMTREERLAQLKRMRP